MEWNIVARNIWFKYSGSEYVLRNTNITIDPGSITVIVGPTGSGKTTLLLILSGLLKPSKGAVYYNGRLLQEILPDIRKHIGVLFQDPNDQLFNSTVYDEIAYSLRTLGLSEDDVRSRVFLVSRLLGIEHLLGKRPYSLSMGEKKKVALASIIVYDPDILFLDEPLANLDYSNSRLLEKIIFDFKKSRKNIVVTTHSIEFALRIGDKIYGIVDGEVRGPYSPLEFIEKGLETLNASIPLVFEVCGRMGLKPTDIIKMIRNS